MIHHQPLAERMRPKSLDDYMGQQHLVGSSALFRKNLESGNIHSFILWGPPGVGKTTLARIIANEQKRPFFTLSAISAGIKDVREVFEKAEKSRFFNSPKPVLFIDEIHRFNKAQQDGLLGAVENGTITLIGATTENPSFEVIPPLLSRCQVYILKPLDHNDLITLAQRAILYDPVLKTKNIRIEQEQALVHYSGGDGRKLLNILELVVDSSPADEVAITNESVEKHILQNISKYDKGGELHYDIISAFIKSIRGSDPNAAVYWLARMVEGGEDPTFIARRLVIFAAEDIGLANPTALILATQCFEAVQVIGWPESRIILSEATIYLASSPKSNAAYMAINDAQEKVRSTGDLPIPLHLRNAPTKLMKDIGYGKDYKYAHSYADHFVKEEYMPEKLANTVFYHPQENAREDEIKKRLMAWWKGKYYS